MKVLSALLFATALYAFALPAPQTPAQLGEHLFFDPILSADSTISCGSCHLPAFGFADTAVVSRGVGGSLGRRNAPGVTNMTARPYFFYDGRAGSLEAQVLMPIEDPLEMKASLPTVLKILRKHPIYGPAFKRIYGHAPKKEDLAAALAAYVRTLETSDTPFDRWVHGKPGGMSESAVRGRQVFMNKGKCFDCHFSPDFTGDEFRNIGLFNGKNLGDVGRFAITKDSADLGKFKVPGLRNTAVTAPYMHNGMFKTLEEVIDYYDQPDRFVSDALGRDTLLAKPLGLTPEEKTDLKAFMEALTDDRFRKQP